MQKYTCIQTNNTHLYDKVKINYRQVGLEFNIHLMSTQSTAGKFPKMCSM